MLSMKPVTAASSSTSISAAVRLKNASISPGLVSASAKGLRASFSACISRAVLSIMPLFSMAHAAPRSRQRIEQKR
jgi:hypothetical protein